MGKTKITKADVIKCQLCFDAPCNGGCPHFKPADILRKIYFDNKVGAAALLPSENKCAECAGECMKRCIKPGVVNIKGVISDLSDEKIEKAEHDKSKLRIDFFGFELENPFLLSSSCVGSNYDMCKRAFDAGWAGVAYKTISMMDIHETSPRFSATKGPTGSIIGFKNIEQLSDHSLEENMSMIRRLKDEYPNKLILASIMGRNEEEWEYLAHKLTEAGADALELNFSCPNMEHEGLGSDVGSDNDLIERFTRAAKRGTHLPIIAKLTPNVGEMSSAGLAAKRGGADGLAAINTIKSLVAINGIKDIKNNKDTKIAIGGMSGPSVKPIALRFIAELSQNKDINLPISGMGGVETSRDAVEFISMGASSVQVTTAVMIYGYRIIEDLCEGLLNTLDKYGFNNVAELVGFGLKTVEDIHQMERDIVILPKFDRTKCDGCGRCFVSCRDGGHQAIRFGENRRPILLADKCVGCHLCILVCPNEAIESSKVIMKRPKQSN